MNVDIRERLGAIVDGTPMDDYVSAYFAYGEECPDAEKPYCLNLSYGGRSLGAALKPYFADEYTSEEEAAGLSRRQVLDWLEVLGELVFKAQKWDELQQEPAGLDVALTANTWLPQVIGEPFDGPGPVDKLTEDEIDSEWLDSEGDRYKYFDGHWHIWDEHPATNSWERLDIDDEAITDYGPYIPVPPDTSREPRKVKQLSETERDAEWVYTNFCGEKFHYRWNSKRYLWECNRETRGEWVDLTGNHALDGPSIGSGANDFLIEILDK